MGVIVMMSFLGKGRAVARPQCFCMWTVRRRERWWPADQALPGTLCIPLSGCCSPLQRPRESVARACLPWEVLCSSAPEGEGAHRSGSTVERGWVTRFSSRAGSSRTYKRKVTQLVLA